MGALAETQTKEQNQAAVAELERSEDALRQLPGSRGDTESNQLPGERTLNFDGTETGTGAGGSSGVAEVGTQTQTQTQTGGEGWESVLDFARQNGYDVGQHQDDRSFLQSLLQQANSRKQEDYYAQLGRQYAREYVNRQQQPQAPAAPAAPRPWEAPQFDRRWMGLVEYDPNSGMFIGKSPTVPAEIVDKVNQYQAWSEKYNSNPTAVLEPYVNDRVQNLVKEQVQQQVQQYRREQAVSSLIQSNSDWMYQKDQTGQLVVGQNGRYIPTPDGLKYGQYVNELERSGITDPYTVDRYAKAQLMADRAYDQQRQQQRQAPGAQAANAGAGSRPQSNVRQSRGPLEAPANEPLPDQSEMRLEDRLRANLASAGYGNDEDFKFGDF